MADQFTPVPKPDDYPQTTGTISRLPEVVKEAKSGYKTTEFWVAIAVSVAAIIEVIPVPTQYEGALAGVLAVAYALSRGLAKQGVPHVEA